MLLGGDSGRLESCVLCACVSLFPGFDGQILVLRV